MRERRNSFRNSVRYEAYTTEICLRTVMDENSETAKITAGT